MNFRRLAVCAASIFVLLVPCLTAHADTIVSLTPSYQYAQHGQLVSVDLFIDSTRLGQGIPPSLGGFSVDLLFDPNLVFPYSYSVEFGSLLGDPSDNNATITFVNPQSWELQFFEVSLLTPDELDKLQTQQKFLLGTITFTTTPDITQNGVLSLNPTVQLTDALGAELLVDKTIGAAIVVPEPASFCLLVFWLPAVLAAARRN